MPKDNIEIQIGANIRKIRTLRGLSRQAVGDKLDVSQQTIEKYEKGQNGVDAATLVRIAAFLGCQLMDLVHGVDELVDTKAQPEVSIHRKSDQDMLRHYHELPEATQTAVRDFTRKLATITKGA